MPVFRCVLPEHVLAAPSVQRADAAARGDELLVTLEQLVPGPQRKAPFAGVDHDGRELRIGPEARVAQTLVAEDAITLEPRDEIGGTLRVNAPGEVRRPAAHAVS